MFRVRVLQAKTADPKPIAGAVVCVDRRRERISDTNGEARFELPGDDDYTIRATDPKTGQSIEVIVPVKEGEIVTVRINNQT